MGDAHDAVPLPIVCFAEQVMCHGVALFYFDSLLCRSCHGGIVFLHVAYVGKTEVGGDMFRLYFGHAFQQFVRLVQFAGLGVDLGEISHGLEVFLNGKGFSEAFDGVVCTAHALCAHTVILEYLKILLFVFLFLICRTV